jgi:hypothetical protein
MRPSRDRWRGCRRRSPPKKLGAGDAVARAAAHIEIGFDGDEHQLTVVFSAERNMCGAEQVDLVPLVHLGDPPAPGEGAGEARRAPGHGRAPISFGSRTRS